MALVEKKAGTSLILKVENGQSASGTTLYANRTISSVNPAAVNQDVYDIGKSVAALLNNALNAVIRKDLTDLAEN